MKTAELIAKVEQLDKDWFEVKEKKGEKMKTITINGQKYVKESDIPKGKTVAPNGDKSNPFFEVGKAYFIRTVTNYFTGRLVWIGDKELVIEDVAWIADTGRFNEFLQGKALNEAEPYPSGSKIIIGRGSLVDAFEWPNDLILKVK